MRPICLCMIVCNEAATIDRCLFSARGVVDRYFIVDTGSTDGTIAKIEGFEGLDGDVVERPWVDFGHNRTELLALAPEGYDLLTLDADMTVQATMAPRFDGAEALNVPISGDHDESGPVLYSLPLLLRGFVTWEYRGAAHEYLCRADGELGDRAPVDGWHVEHHGDGGSRGDKLKRDRKLLRKAIDHGNEGARSTFYLAQTEALLGKPEKALDLYVRRADLGGWEEEVYVALLRAGRLAIELDAWDRAQVLFWRAYDLRPSRAEALYEISGEARHRGQFNLAHLAASKGVTIPRPDDTLFVAGWVYEYAMLFEFSVTSQRAGDFAAAAEAVDRLFEIETLPDAYKAAAARNRAEYGVPAGT